MKIRFKCCGCGEEFNVDSKNFLKKQSLECPNCGRVFPQNALEKLRNAIQNINDVMSLLEQPVAPNVITSRPFYSWEFKFIEN